MHRLLLRSPALLLALAGCEGTLGPSSAARLVVADGEGHVATVSVEAPHAVLATTTFGANLGSVRCDATRCTAVRHAPDDELIVFRSTDLSVVRRLPLRGVDPTDAALVGASHAVVVGRGDALLRVVDLVDGGVETVDLAPLADADGNPEADRLAVCDRRVFVQLDRMDAETGAPDPAGARLAVVDVADDGTGTLHDADPDTSALDGVVLAGRADFDMPTACGAGRLHVSEPKPLFQGGSAFETVDLATLVASPLEIPGGAQLGGFVVVDEGLYWLVSHTDFGPGPSSHLEFLGGPETPTYNTFADHHLDELAYDASTESLFFPDACVITPSNTACTSGLHVFSARTGEHRTPEGIDVGFPPSEVALAR